MTRVQVDELVDQLEARAFVLLDHRTLIDAEERLTTACRERGLEWTAYIFDDFGWRVFAARPGTDEATGLLNWASRLQLRESPPVSADTALILVDIDQLTTVSRNLPSVVARTIVESVGRALCHELAAGELGYRLGDHDDAFEIILPEATVQHAEARARRFEAVADEIDVPAAAAGLYRGASAAFVMRRLGEPLQQMSRAAEGAVAWRKLHRAELRALRRRRLTSRARSLLSTPGNERGRAHRG